MWANEEVLKEKIHLDEMRTLWMHEATKMKGLEMPNKYIR